MTNKEVIEFYNNLDKNKEERVTKPKVLDIYQNKINFKNKVGTVDYLIEIHKYLFNGIYKDFAGLIRDGNITKGRTKFCLAQFINDNINEINNKQDNTFDNIIEKYSDLNMLHPFYEGNGRSERIWLDVLLKDRLSKVVNWNNISKDDYHACMIKSIYDISDLKELIKENLTDKITDINIYLNGIDSSYNYENMKGYKTKDLIENKGVV